MAKISPLTQKFSQLKSNIGLSSLLGNYKDYKTARKEFASLAMNHFETSMTAPGAKIQNVPLFSKPGMNILKVIILDFFRKKTPAEKQYKKMLKDFKKAQKIIKEFVRIR